MNKIFYLITLLFLVTGCTTTAVSVTELPKDARGNIEVAIQDQHTPIIDLKLSQEINTGLLVQNTNIDDRTIIISSSIAPLVGNLITLKSFNGSAFMQSEILTVTPLGGNSYSLFLDMPLDYDFTTSDLFSFGSSNWAVNGAITEQVFDIKPSGTTTNVSWDITRIMFSCVGDGMDTAGDPKPDYTAFFVMDPITNGIFIRHQNGITKNIFNAKSNSELASRMYDINLITELNKNGLYTTFAKRTFNGLDKNGVTVRLNSWTNDSLELVVQDDLTDMTKCETVVQGHIVE